MATHTDTLAGADFDPVARDDPEVLRQVVQRMLQQFREAERGAQLSAARYERSEGRQG